jgi:hypothetical protein
MRPRELTGAETGEPGFRFTPAQWNAWGNALVKASKAREAEAEAERRPGDPLPTKRDWVKASRASRIRHRWGVGSVNTEVRLALRYARFRVNSAACPPRCIDHANRPRARRRTSRVRARSPGRPGEPDRHLARRGAR